MVKDRLRKIPVAIVVSILYICAAVAASVAFTATRVSAQPPIDPPIRPRPRVPIVPIPPRPLPGNAVSVKEVSIDAQIKDGVAQTEITHRLINRTASPQEADFLFPIPAGAEVSSFALYDGEKKMEGHLLDKDEATATYEEIVRRRRDPALLTFQGRAALRARVFPVAPGSERKITLKLISVLPRQGNSRKYSWTLVGPHLPGAARPEKVSVHVRVTGNDIGSIYSPTHTIDQRRTDTGVDVSFETHSADTQLSENPDFDLFIGAKSDKAVALSLLTYNAALPQVASLTGGVRQSGYFLVVASPTVETSGKTAPPRRVVMVMDRSGSMQGKKIEQAKGALRFALGKLRPQDRFNIVTFSDNVENFAPEPILASVDNRKRAEAFIDQINADGGTNINQALLTGLKQFPERSSSNTLLFFTDGLPTVGTRSQDQIVQNAIKANEKKARTFVFGVGYDVDVPFLDNVARSLRGDADYVRPDEDIEVKTSQFVAKTSAAVLENVKLTVEGGHVGEIYPKPADMPDLFAGSQLVIVGRYTGGSENVRLALSGQNQGTTQTFELSAKLPAVETGADFLPRLWASRKIGYLMDEVRLRPDADTRKEMIDQIVALSREYGILTPYTSLFVPEPVDNLGVVPVDTTRPVYRSQPMLDASGSPGGGGFRGGAPATPGAAVSLRKGESAVNVSQGARAQRNQAVVGNSLYLDTQAGADRERGKDFAKRIQNVNARSFYFTRALNLWQDATYDAKKQTDIVKIKLFSPAYFALLHRNADYAKWAAIGENVLIVANAKQAIQFSNEGKETLTPAELKTLAGK